MPWFPDFASAVELSRQQTRTAAAADPVAQYFTLLNTGGLLTATSYTDSTTSPDSTWYYQVVVVDTVARVSPAACLEPNPS